jgi:NAD-dependent SIR2 family protein deacetylase
MLRKEKEREEKSEEKEENINDLQVEYPDEVTRSIYWRERASRHIKPFSVSNSSSSFSTALSQAIDQAAHAILQADCLIFVTGAGAGVDMGLPDFRTSAQFWIDLNHPGIERYEDSSDVKWFELEPDFMWGLNYHQLSMYRSATIHEGYLAMLELAAMKNGNYFCYTSNIDGVFQRAGFDRLKVREIHGNIHRLQCTRYDCLDKDGHRDAWEAHVELGYDPVTFRAKDSLPICRNCSCLARPNVWYCRDNQYVLYSESRLVSDIYFKWLDQIELTRQKIAVIECGAGLVIPSARIESELLCERFRGSLIRINPVDYMVPSVSDPESGGLYEMSIGIPLGAAKGLTQILDRVKELTERSKRK